MHSSIYGVLGREPVHPFPARMAPDIALDVISKAGQRLRVLDPMAGSGTVLALARAKGHRAIGIDIDPLAVMMARVWTTAIDMDAAITKAAEILHKAEKRFLTLPSSDAYPTQDDETRKFIRYWFDDSARRQLAALSFVIRRVRNET